MASLKIAGLGSSFAAGPGISPTVDKKARRSARNYASLLAEKLEAQLADLSTSGATLQNVLDTTQKLAWNQPSFPPQLELLPPDADIITLTAGGNDLGYSRGMILESMLASLPLVLSWPLSWFIKPTDSTLSSSELADRFIAVIDKSREIAPKAQFYLIEYVKLFGAATKPRISSPLSQSAISRYQSLELRLLEAYEMSAKARPAVKLIRMENISKGYEIGSTSPWVNGFSWMGSRSGGAPYHPNAEAHEIIDELLYQAIIKQT